MTDIVEKLRSQAADAVDAHGETMKKWDEIRAACLTYRGSDLPRLMFESLIDDLAEIMMEASDEITRLRKALMPFAHYFKANDCDERRDDDALEVPIGDLRRARAALTSTDSNTTGNIEGGA